jgi:hypothetical protein
MRPAHHSAASWQASTSPSPGSHESQTTHTHSARPSSQSAPSPVACTRTGSPDRNTRTACTNAAQMRTSDISDPRAGLPAPSRIVRSETRRVFPADSRVADPSHGPTSVDRSCVPRAASAAPACAAHDRCLDIQAADISPQSLPSTARIVSPAQSRTQVPASSSLIARFHFQRSSPIPTCDMLSSRPCNCA